MLKEDRSCTWKAESNKCSHLISGASEVEHRIGRGALAPSWHPIMTRGGASARRLRARTGRGTQRWAMTKVPPAPGLPLGTIATSESSDAGSAQLSAACLLRSERLLQSYLFQSGLLGPGIAIFDARPHWARRFPTAPLFTCLLNGCPSTPGSGCPCRRRSQSCPGSRRR